MAQSKTVPVKVQKRSGFDKTHKVLTSIDCGTITPLLTDELMPGSTVNLKLDLAAQLPPLASDVYARMAIKAEAFFVPHRLVYGGYQKFITGDKVPYFSAEGYDIEETDVCLPLLSIAGANSSTAFRVGGLLDMMDCRYAVSTGATTQKFNLLPVLAYHKVWDDWYRNSLVQRPCFADMSEEESGAPSFALSCLPWRTISSIAGNPHQTPSYSFANGIGLLDMHQRNFESDYFTNATPDAQTGDARKVTVSANTFSIESLRVANALQKFEERNNLAGTQYVDYLKAHYGVDLNDGIAQRSILLGSAKFNVYTKGVYSTAGDTLSVDSNYTTNPWLGQVGGKVGSAYAQGSEFIINGFTANEPGTLLVLITLMPEGTSYSTGTDRMWMRYNTATIADRMDLANPELQGVGNQPIYQAEIKTGVLSANPDSAIFGYTERYADWKTKKDSVRGLFRDNGSIGDSQQALSSFVLQRSFVSTSAPQINSSFLEVPKNYMNGITLASSEISRFGAWVDSQLEYHVIMPLAEYCQPTLEQCDEEHGNTVYVSRNGSKL